MILVEIDGARCDDRCVNARGKKCDCVCDGFYHGLGWERALKQYDRDVAAGYWRYREITTPERVVNGGNSGHS